MTIYYNLVDEDIVKRVHIDCTPTEYLMLNYALDRIELEEDSEDYEKLLKQMRLQMANGFNTKLKLKYKDHVEKRTVNETMASLLIPLKNHLDSRTADAVDVVLRILQETEVENDN